MLKLFSLTSRVAGSIFSIGEALLLFLEALPEPVIPYKYQSRCLEACNNYVLCKQVTYFVGQCVFMSYLLISLLFLKTGGNLLERHQQNLN